MVKITLFDNCCASCTSGTAKYFVDNLAEFETPWLAQATDPDQIQRFQQSRDGAVVTDYYSDDPSLNIVQIDDDAEVLSEFTRIYSDFHLDIFNAYNCATHIYAAQAEIRLRYIQFQGVPHLVGRYSLHGVCQEWWFTETPSTMYQQLCLWGNTIFSSHFQEQPPLDNPFGDWRDHVHPKEAYQNDHVETFCWLHICSDPDGDIAKQGFDTLLTEEFLSNLMLDIVGEAG